MASAPTALQPIFTKQHVRDFGGHMAQAAEMVADGWADGAEIDLDTECRRLTLRALGRSVLGLDLDEHSDAIAEPLRSRSKYIADRALQPLRAPRWLPTPARRRARAASEHAAPARRRDPAGVPRRSRPRCTTGACAHRGHRPGDRAGTVRRRNPRRAHRVHVRRSRHHSHDADLRTMGPGPPPRHAGQGRAEVTGIGDRELTPEDVPGLGYTIQVLHEALRLCPPAAATGRMAMQDIEVDGYRVEAGTMLVVGIYALHRDPALWDHPLVFDPDRFSPQNSKGRDRWQYLPFGAGPRSCIGDHFAMLEATLALATIIRRTEIQSIDPEFPMIVPFTTVAAAPIRARVKARANA